VVELFTIFVLVLLLLERPKMWSWAPGQMTPGHRATVTRVAGDVSQKVTGYMAGNLLTSLIAGTVVFVTLLILGVPFPLLWGLWVALVDFLPMIGGALAGIPTVLFAFIARGLTTSIVTAAVFLVYTQIENPVLNPVVMSKTVRINPLLVFIAVLVGASLGTLIGGIFGREVSSRRCWPSRRPGHSRCWPGRSGRPPPGTTPSNHRSPRLNKQTSAVTLPPNTDPSDHPGRRPDLTTMSARLRLTPDNLSPAGARKANHGLNVA
jgi:AI-2E family transporter